MTKEQNRTIWILILSSSLILAITMGVRQSLGLFIAPINSSTSLDIISISLALAIGQFIWGLTQPIFGAIADKKGSFGVLVFGALFLGAMDLQTASKSELMEIKGVGEKKADAIIEYRKTNTIKSAEDLKNIKGFGDTIIDNVKNNVKAKSNPSKKDEKNKSKDEDNKESKKNKNSKSEN